MLDRYSIRGPILDLGCGRGGITRELARATHLKCTGIDKEPVSISVARHLAIDVPNCYFACRYIESIHNMGAGLIVMCDVIEHMHPTKALAIAAANLIPGGYMYVSFPPWRSPFGGHQQICKCWLKHFPWAHLIATQKAYKYSLEHARDRGHIDSVYTYRLTIGRFEEYLKNGDWKVVYRGKHLIRPELSREGMPHIPAPSFMPECFITGVDYLITRD